jgi:20S proteasome subunit alpha 4
MEATICYYNLPADLFDCLCACYEWIAGHLFQVEYALEAVNKGNTAAAVRGQSSSVLAVDKKSTVQLQETQSIRKILQLDEHLALAAAGLTADARVLVNRARVECQSYKLTMGEPIHVDSITRWIAGLQQKYTQSGGVRPFGISTLVVGTDPMEGSPKLFQTDPSGSSAEWKANAIGRNSSSVREWLEKNYEPTDGEDTIRLTAKALLEVVEADSRNIEMAVMDKDGMHPLSETRVDTLVKEIEAQKQEETNRRRRPQQQQESEPQAS